MLYLNLMFFCGDTMDKLKHAEKSKHCENHWTSLGINCLNLCGYFLTHIPWKFKFYSSTHIVEPS